MSQGYSIPAVNLARPCFDFRGLTTGGALINARIEHFGPAMRVISHRAGEAKGTACRCYQGDESSRVIAEPCRRQYSAHRACGGEG